MTHTYMLWYTEPSVKNQYPVAECYIHNKNVAHSITLGMDYAGGRIVATSEDLLKFMKSLTRYEILRKETMEKMKDWAKFSIGIDYGYGIMNFKHVPILRSEEHTSELQSRFDLVCRLLLEKNNSKLTSKRNYI